MDNNSEETQFDRFWQASSLDKFNVQQFASQLSAYDSDDKQLLLEYPLAAESLPLPRTSLNKTSKQRASQRNFSEKKLSLKELGLIFSSFYAWNGLEHRGYPSAGATYATEIFGITFNTEKFNQQIVYYDPEEHGLITVSEQAPTWDESKKSLNITTEGSPAVLLLFVTFPERATAKYGERGGRFALLEAGAAMQQLALQLAETKLKGVAVGGTLDDVWLKHLQLSHTDAHLTLGYLVGK